MTSTVQSCDRCAKLATCNKSIGFMFGYCVTDFEPIEEKIPAPRTCSRCGVEIVNGVNGCQLSQECFTCHPISYPKQTPRPVSVSSWDDLDTLEGRCLGGGIE